MTTIGSLFVSLGLTTKEFEAGMGKVTSLAKAGLAGIGVGMVAVGAGMAEVGRQSFDLSKDIDASAKDIQSSLRVTAEMGEELAGIATDVWANNFGDSIGDVSKVLVEVNKQLGLTGKELQNATEDVYRITDAFDSDFDKTINASMVLMEEFGISQDQAFDLIASGFQKGLNSSDDFLDTITEYGNLFGESGASAGEFFSILETGLQGGVLGTDKVADAFKEFQIRFLEGGKDIQAAIGDLTGDDWQMFIDEIQAGDSTIMSTFETFKRVLGEIEDPIEQNRIGVALFGTQFEDLGASAVLGIDTAKTALEDMAGATDSLNTQYETFDQFASGVWRQMLVAIEPVTGELLKLANESMPFLQEVFAAAQPVFEAFGQEMSETIKPALLIIMDAVRRIGEVFGLTNDEMSDMDVLVASLKGGLDLLVTALEAVAITAQLVADALEGMKSGVSFLDSNSTNIVGKLGQIGGTITGVSGISQGLGALGFKDGGVVPGPKGAAQLAVVHGQETIIPAGQTMGGGDTYNIQVGDVMASGEGGADEAIQALVELLRQQLQAAGA